MREAVVVGGGLAGGAAATLLAQAGWGVQLLERASEPVDKVCGEFLSVEAQHSLARLGIDLDRLGATRIGSLRLAMGSRVIEVPLPFVARGLTRKRLDNALLNRAVRAGVQVDRGVAVRSIQGGIVQSTCGEIRVRTLLVASGKHDVRGAARNVSGCETGYVGFKCHWRLGRRARLGVEGKVDVILFDGGYAGVQMVEGECANLCLLITRERLAAIGGGWPALLQELLREPHILALLGDAEPCTSRPLTIAGVPYGFLHRPSGPTDLFRLGDQAAVIPSFCGEGMAIALHSAALAAGVIRKGGSSADYSAILTKGLRPPLRWAMALQRAGQRPWSRTAMWHGLRSFPHLASGLVRLTRVPCAATLIVSGNRGRADL